MIYNKQTLYKQKGIYNGDSVYNGNGVYNGENKIKYIEILGRIYPFVKIDDLWVMCENLDYSDENLVEDYNGSVTNGLYCWNYQRNYSVYGYEGKKFGKYYLLDAILYINSLLNNGFRIFSKNDIDKILSNTTYEQNKSVEYWSNAGNNESYLNCFPTGMYKSTSKQWELFNSECILGTTTEHDYVSEYAFDLENHQQGITWFSKDFIAVNIRVCIDE